MRVSDNMLTVGDLDKTYVQHLKESESEGHGRRVQSASYGFDSMEGAHGALVPNNAPHSPAGPATGQPWRRSPGPARLPARRRRGRRSGGGPRAYTRRAVGWHAQTCLPVLWPGIDTGKLRLVPRRRLPLPPTGKLTESDMLPAAAGSLTSACPRSRIYS